MTREDDAVAKDHRQLQRRCRQNRQDGELQTALVLLSEQGSLALEHSESQELGLAGLQGSVAGRPRVSGAPAR